MTVVTMPSAVMNEHGVGAIDYEHSDASHLARRELEAAVMASSLSPNRQLCEKPWVKLQSCPSSDREPPPHRLEGTSVHSKSNAQEPEQTTSSLTDTTVRQGMSTVATCKRQGRARCQEAWREPTKQITHAAPHALPGRTTQIELSPQGQQQPPT